jgi:signal transduction histidine kinase
MSSLLEAEQLSALLGDTEARDETWRLSETSIAVVRLAVVLFNGLMFVLATRPDATAPGLAYGVLAFAAVYSVAVLVWRPYERFGFRPSSLTVSLLDAALITLWLYATGGFASPYFPLWYVSAVALSFRFGAWETLVGSVVYAASYASLIAAEGTLVGNVPTVGVRVGYIFLAGGLASLLSMVAYQQTVAKQAYQDVAERLEAARDEARDHASELERINEDLREVASAISHDVREPLRVIDGYAGLLERQVGDDLDDDQAELLGQIRDSTARLDGMIDSLLAFVRFDRSQPPVERVELEDALDAALANLGVRIEEEGATIEHEDLPAVTGDPDQIASIFQNLVGNAVKYGGEDPTVRVRTDDQAPEGMERVLVEDDGVGIPENEKEHVFEIFQRGSHRDDDAGHGVGLALCRRLVERHGGEIDLVSTPGEGSTFRFTLPAAGAQPPDVAARAVADANR